MKKKTAILIAKIFGIMCGVVLSAAIGVGAAYFQHTTTKISSNLGNSTVDFNQDNILTNPTVAGKEDDDDDDKTEEYSTFALFGVDSRYAQLGEGNRSDVVMLITLNNKTKDVTLTSVYRDTLVSIPGYGYDKLTHAYSMGGPELALSTLNTNFDLNIKDYITINFRVAETVVDMLGGIDVEIASNEVAPLNKYVTTLAGEGADTNVQLLYDSGVQTLTGSQAVAYTRIRKLAGGDYKRAKRQRTILNAALEKAKSTDFITLTSIINEVVDSGSIKTNLTKDRILELAADVFNYKIQDSQGFPYHVKNAKQYTYASPTKRTFVGIPKIMAEDVKTLHYTLYGEGTPSTVDESSDSELAEGNGRVNDANSGYSDSEAETDPETGETLTTEETTETTPVVNADKPYEPSDVVKDISEELQNRMYD